MRAIRVRREARARNPFVNLISDVGPDDTSWTSRGYEFADGSECMCTLQRNSGPTEYGACWDAAAAVATRVPRRLALRFLKGKESERALPL